MVKKRSKAVLKAIKKRKVVLAKREQNIQCRTKYNKKGGYYKTCYDTVSKRQLRRASAKKSTGRKPGRPKGSKNKKK